MASEDSKVPRLSEQIQRGQELRGQLVCALFESSGAFELQDNGTKALLLCSILVHNFGKAQLH